MILCHILCVHLLYTLGCESERKLEVRKFHGSPRYVFFLSGRSWAAFNIHGIPRHNSGGTQHPRDTTGPDPFTRRTPLDILDGTQYPRDTRRECFNHEIPRDVLRGIQQQWDSTKRDSLLITGFHEMFCARSSNHRIRQQR